MHKIIGGILVISLFGNIILFSQTRKLRLEIGSKDKTVELLMESKKHTQKQLLSRENELHDLELDYRELNSKYKKAVSRGESRTLNMEVTAYAPTGNPTKSGVMPQVGRTIAVDPNVIPLGSKVYIEGIGYRIAEDTGGAIKGNIIDLFMGSESECIEFGRQNLKIQILGGK